MIRAAHPGWYNGAVPSFGDPAARLLIVGLAPGLRVGYLVAAAGLIQEARLLRRLILRHPPSNNQRTVALFISGGYYDSLIHRLQRVYRERWEAMGEALSRHLPQSATAPPFARRAAL